MMEDGRFQGVLSMLMDITARRSVEARLAQSEAQLREAQAIAHVGSWDWDLTTNVMTRSEECRRIQGLTRVDEPPGRSTDYDTIHPDDRELVAQSIERAIRDRTPWVCDYRLVRADGVRSVHSRGHVIVDGSGVAVRFVGTVHDVTEKREAEARVVLSDRLASVGTLALGVAHEINNPLAALTANLDMIAEEIRKLEGVATSDQLREIADMARQAREAAERVRSIVGGLRTFSRADEDRTVLLDLRRVLELAIEVAFHESRHSARLVKDYGEAPMVLADEGRLGRVFINLLVNAAQSFDEGPTERNEIRVVTGTLADGRAFVEVRDTGRGIPRELQSRIFDPFFTTKAVGVGAGLGLSICHGIVAALRGELTVESDVARGSTFRVVLPRGQPREREEPPAVHEKVAQAKRARVLIVDDDAGVAKALARVLRAHDVVLATNGREALDLLVAGRIFDVILCDMMMPVMSGMELYAQLAATLPDLARKIVFVTGGTFTPPAKAFLDNVPNERIGKPFDMDPLRAMVERAAQ
jgi:PAS domain S-box-containing protein